MITESQLADMLDRTYFQTKENALRFAFDLMGIKVVQDPKPPMTAVEEWIEERQAVLAHVLKHPHPDPAAEWAQAALDALEAVLKVHTPIEVNHAFKGRTNVCEQCSEDRLYALWPCETVEAIEGAINHE